MRSHYSLDQGPVAPLVDRLARLYNVSDPRFGRLALKSARLKSREGYYNWGLYLLHQKQYKMARMAFKYLLTDGAEHWAHQVVAVAAYIMALWKQLVGG